MSEERFECGCAASNVEWVREHDNPNKYEHVPRRDEHGARVCPVHGVKLEGASGA